MVIHDATPPRGRCRATTHGVSLHLCRDVLCAPDVISAPGHYHPSVGIGDIGKRVLLGRKLRSAQLGETLLPKRIALPVFASDALSSVAYAPDEILLTLSIAGMSAYAWSWKIAICVAVVMLTVIASYRQNVHAYPSGGGDYEVATVNLGKTFGLVVGSALLVDYVLTVAVSISSGVQNAASAVDAIDDHKVWVAVGLVLLLMAINLRGVKESGTAFAIPTYTFMVCIIGMTIWGMIRSAERRPAAGRERAVRHRGRVARRRAG